MFYMAVDQAAPTSLDVLNAARRLYPDRSLASLIQRHRPRICPLDAVIAYVPQGAEVLDIGCGGGLLLGLLAALNRNITGHGIDTSAASVALARAMSERIGDTESILTWEHRDATADWPAKQYDVVTMVDLLHHVPVSAQPDVFARAMASVRPGGTLIYKDMVTRPRWRAAANQLHDLASAREWIHHVPVSAVEEWAHEGGLTLTHSEQINILWYGHDLRVFVRAA